ncbi:MAG TPA: hypothetical protein VNR42_05720 [Solirubrobacteraceae bacterium]|nr:hypothetical protein [Solirubrobacteraceae bacterium]
MPDQNASARAHEGPPGDGSPPSDRGRVFATAIKLAATAAVLAGASLLAGAATWSNLNATVTNPSNSFSVGTVNLSSNSPSSAVLSLAGAEPGDFSTGCIRISYTGTLPAELKLYGTGAGSGLNQYLMLVVTRGSFSGTPSSGSCTGFTADTTNYIAQGAGVIYSGVLAALPSTAASALIDPTSANPATWDPQSTHGYRLQVTVLNDARAQGLNGRATFTFEADSI